MTKDEQDQIILDNQKLIYKVIKDMHCTYTTEDELQEYYDCGLEGLIKGARSYDKNSGYAVSTYLYVCIKNMIIRYFYLSELDKRKINKIKKISLDQQIGDENDNTVGEVIPDEKVDVEQQIENKINLESIKNELKKMKLQKDAQCISMYYGLDGNKPMKLEEIAEVMGISRSAVGQKINRGINNLKKRKEIMVQSYMKENSLIKEEKNTIFKKENEITPLEQVSTILLEQLIYLKKLDVNDKDIAKMEIVKSNAMALTSKTLLQTIGMQMMLDKKQIKYEK